MTSSFSFLLNLVSYLLQESKAFLECSRLLWTLLRGNHERCLSLTAEPSQLKLQLPIARLFELYVPPGPTLGVPVVESVATLFTAGIVPMPAFETSKPLRGHRLVFLNRR
jgi:hypothetical protein